MRIIEDIGLHGPATATAWGLMVGVGTDACEATR